MKRLLVLAMVLTMSGCSALNFFSSGKEKSVKNEYSKLSARFDILVDSEINEKDRARLEEDFKKYRDKINMSGGKDVDYNNVVREYVNKSDIKIQYLKDLKD